MFNPFLWIVVFASFVIPYKILSEVLLMNNKLILSKNIAMLLSYAHMTVRQTARYKNQEGGHVRSIVS